MTRSQDFPGDSHALAAAIARLTAEPRPSEQPSRAAAAALGFRGENPFGRMTRQPQVLRTHSSVERRDRESSGREASNVE